MMSLTEKIATALLEARGFTFTSDPSEGGQDAFDASSEALREAEAVLKVFASHLQILQRARVDDAYMLLAYEQMLGPKGRQVVRRWREQGVVRQHTSWAIDPMTMQGEDVAQVHLDTEAAEKTPVDSLD